MASAALNWDFQPRRGKARLRLGIPADLLTAHGRCRVTLLDLSESGARLHYEGGRIADGVLMWLDFEKYGSVVRHTGREVGLRFEQPIDPEWVLATREWLDDIARGDDVRRYAMGWARGDESGVSSADGRARALPYVAAFAEVQAGYLDRRRVNWLRTGKPVWFGAIVIGLIAGYWSAFV